MTKTLPRLLAVAAICALSWWLLKPSTPITTAPTAELSLPWSIRLHPDGTSTVFGLRLETTSVAEALQLLGEDYEIGIISDTRNRSSLEIYYSRFSSGPLKARLIISVDATQAELQLMQAAASKSSYSAAGTGARKFQLSSADLARVQQWPISGLTLIPAANLDADTIVARFGEPAQKLARGEQETHFLYPAQGLDISLNKKAKELLQYVAPRSFTRLSAPLQTGTAVP